MNLQENINRIKEMMGHTNNDDQENIIRKNHFTNKYGETMNLIEKDNGDVYLKHDDYKNKYIKLDDLVKDYKWSQYGDNYKDEIRLSIILNKEEKDFLCDFLKSTKYDYLIPHIISQKF